MKNLFFRKQARIEQGFEEFLGCIQRSLELFCAGMLSYLEHGPGESFERSMQLVERAETKADKLRREIETVLYKNELLPDSRGDMLNLLESLDRVPNRIETVIRNVCMRRVEIPKEMAPNLKEMLVPVQTCVETLLTAVRMLFSEPSTVRAAVDDVDRLESECDAIQYRTIREVYAMDLELASKMQLEQMLSEIGGIADRAEDVGTVVEIIAIKRMV